MMFPSRSRPIPLAFPRSVCGICHDSRNTPFDENFCTRPVMSAAYRLSCVSTATERGLLSSPTPTPRFPMTRTRLKIRLWTGAFRRVVGGASRKGAQRTTELPLVAWPVSWIRNTRRVTRTRPHMPKAYRHRQQRQAQRVHLRVVAVVQQVENAQRQRFAAGRHDQNHGLHIPKAKQEHHIPRGGGLRRDLRPLHLAQHLPARRALQPRGVGEVAVHRLESVSNRGPAQPQVTNHERQDDDSRALIKRRPAAIE